ncbi:MAG: GDSL-type esterase/lipase family protein [Candidatus Cohnella colombiensis]|uniref:GDSL-type esterase/lipase family protein n=1 Tax=Candidatus Cohnella colombiensis TaxID=3121368 RepID=A0AA95EUV6_9BACL|nr:MAG: GDSL-type esterase/lipase family protein [Cohnella sp.]
MSRFNATASVTTTKKPVSIATKTNTFSNGTSNGDASHKDVTYSIKHEIIADTTMIRLVYANWSAGDNDGVNDLTVGGGINVAGVRFIAKFNNGANDLITIKPGGTAVTDPIAVDLKKGDFINSLTFVSVSTLGQTWPYGADMVSGDTMGQGDLRASGSLSASAERAYHPIVILGDGSSSVLLIGDSITAGGGATTMLSSYANRAAIKWGRGVLIGGSSGQEAFSAKALANMKYRMRLAEYATCAVVNYGTNDFFYNRTLQEVKDALLIIGNRLKSYGLKPYICTICPRVTSTDSYATLTNQSPVNSQFAAGLSDRNLLNDWIRTTPAPFVGYIDMADAVESSRNSGKWKVAPAMTADGIHPNNAGHQAMADVLDLVKITAGQIVSVNPNPDITPPAVPTGFTVVAGQESATLSWTNPADLDLYGINIYRDGVRVGATVIGTSKIDTGLTGGTTYSYRISAVDNAGNESALTSPINVTPTAKPVFTPVTDDFNRTASTTTMGNATTGQAWEYLKGVWGITASGRAYAAGGTADSATVVPFGSADATVEATFVISPNNTRLICRATAENAYITVQKGTSKYEMFRRNPGFVAIGDTGVSITPADGDVVKLVCSGSNIKLFVNGIERLSVTETFNQTTGTKHGIGAGSASAEFDNFSIN